MQGEEPPTHGILALHLCAPARFPPEPIPTGCARGHGPKVGKPPGPDTRSALRDLSPETRTALQNLSRPENEKPARHDW